MRGATWWFSVGPLEAPQAGDVVAELESAVGPGVDVLALDWKDWFCRALPMEVVSVLAELVEAGLGQLDVGSERHLIASALLDDMQTWLDRDRT